MRIHRSARRMLRSARITLKTSTELECFPRRRIPAVSMKTNFRPLRPYRMSTASRVAPCARQVLIERGPALFWLDDGRCEFALAQRFFCGEANLGAQLAFADAEDSAGIPRCEWACAAIANRGDPIACDPGLIMNDRNLSTDQAIEQGGLTHVWPADDRDIWQRARLIHYRRPHLRFRWIRMACSLQLPNATCDVNDPGDRSEKASRDHNVQQREQVQLQHNPADRDHLQNGRYFSGPVRFHVHFSNQQIQDACADEENRVTRN